MVNSFLQIALDARSVQRLLRGSDVYLRKCDKRVRAGLPRLVEVKLRKSDAVRCPRQRACSPRPTFNGSKCGLDMAVASNALARLVEANLWDSHRALACARASIWTAKQAQKIND